MLCVSCSVQALCACALCKLVCASCSAQVLPELWECTSRTIFVLTSCDFPAGAAGVCSDVLRLYLKVAIFQPEHAPHTTSVLKSCDFQPELQEHAPRTTFVLKNCDFQAGAAQGGIEPATAGLRKQARKPRDNFQRLFREQEKCTAPQRERFDTHNLCRGFAETKTNSHGATARALRRARSSQRVARGLQKS